MESNWLWNAVYVGRMNWDVRMAARLLTPISGRDWLARIPHLGGQRLYAIAVDSQPVWHSPELIGDVPDTGFPYGFEVDQTALG